MPADPDSIELFAKYNGWVSIHKIAEKTGESVLLNWLASIRDSVEEKAFQLLFDTKDIDAYIDRATSSARINNIEAQHDNRNGTIPEVISDFSKIIKEMDSKEAKALVDNTCKNNDKKVMQNLKKIAYSYIIWKTARKLCLSFGAGTVNYIPKDYPKPKKGEDIEVQKVNTNDPDRVDFFAKWGKWVAIKKMSIINSTKNEEVAMHLALIGDSVDKKLFEMFPADVGKELSSYSDSITKGRNGKLSALAEAISEVASQQTAQVIGKATSKYNNMGQMAYSYLLGKIIHGAGLDYKVQTELLGKAYPEIKVRKPPGRAKKG